MEAKQEKTMAMLCHLSALAGLVIPWVGSVVGPLVVWLIKKDESGLVDEHGKKALNFQISMLIYTVVAGALCFVVIGIPILFGLGIFNLVMIIMNSIKANKGEAVSYPLAITFIK
jgi:hypothetical protein